MIVLKKTEIQEFPALLPGTFWGITTFFNPARFKNKSHNYRIFRKSSRDQGLKLLTIELVFGDMFFELGQQDADILIQLRTKKENILWQKEAMLNIGLKKLPKDCDKIAWVDCDIIFKNHQWVTETTVLLEKYSIIQPFQYCIRLLRGQQDFENNELDKIIKGQVVGDIVQGEVYGIFNESRDRFVNPGWPGYAWAARKKIFDKINFFDYGIIGSGDYFMGEAFIDGYPSCIMDLYSNEMKEKYLDWSFKASKEINKSVYFTRGVILHLWHGEKKYRNYYDRHKKICRLNFSPDFDIKKNEEGLWEWTLERNALQQTISRYFHSREEENSFRTFILSFFRRFWDGLGIIYLKR